MRVSLVEASPSALAGLKQDHIRSLGGRPDAYLEEIISHRGTFHLIESESERLGYCCTDGEGTLLQFYVADDHIGSAEQALALVLEERQCHRALVLTRDRLPLSLFLDLMRSVRVKCHVFEEGPHLPYPSDVVPKLSFRQATPADVPAIRAACGDFHDFLHYTLESSIVGGDIYVLRSGDRVLGTGVIGAREFHPPYVDIGMCVDPRYRRQGVGTEILVRLRWVCREHGWIAGASCQSTNIASKRTLERAGMVARDRVLECTFKADG